MSLDGIGNLFVMLLLLSFFLGLLVTVFSTFTILEDGVNFDHFAGGGPVSSASCLSLSSERRSPKSSSRSLSSMKGLISSSESETAEVDVDGHELRDEEGPGKLSPLKCGETW